MRTVNNLRFKYLAAIAGLFLLMPTTVLAEEKVVKIIEDSKGDFRFDPAGITIKAGDTVKWEKPLNRDCRFNGPDQVPAQFPSRHYAGHHHGDRIQTRRENVQVTSAGCSRLSWRGLGARVGETRCVSRRVVDFSSPLVRLFQRPRSV
jgi:hypothetical protein